MNCVEMRNELMDLLKLDNEPVAINWSVKEPANIKKETGKSRFCSKLEMAMNGQVFYSTSEQEECMGGARYSGLKDMAEYPANVQSGSFMVSKGLYKNIPAIHRSREYESYINPGIFKAIIFAPLNLATLAPDVVFIVCNAKQGMEILHANAFDSGEHGKGADAAPICSSMAASPYMTGKVTYGFGDIASRTNMNIKPEEIMISIPGSDISRIISNLVEMKTKMFFKED